MPWYSSPLAWERPTHLWGRIASRQFCCSCRYFASWPAPLMAGVLAHTHTHTHAPTLLRAEPLGCWVNPPPLPRHTTHAPPLSHNSFSLFLAPLAKQLSYFNSCRRSSKQKTIPCASCLQYQTLHQPCAFPRSVWGLRRESDFTLPPCAAEFFSVCVLDGGPAYPLLNTDACLPAPSVGLYFDCEVDRRGQDKDRSQTESFPYRIHPMSRDASQP